MLWIYVAPRSVVSGICSSNRGLVSTKGLIHEQIQVKVTIPIFFDNEWHIFQYFHYLWRHFQTENVKIHHQAWVFSNEGHHSKQLCTLSQWFLNLLLNWQSKLGLTEDKRIRKASSRQLWTYLGDQSTCTLSQWFLNLLPNQAWAAAQA